MTVRPSVRPATKRPAPPKRSGWPLALSAVIVLAAVTGGGAYLVGASRATPEELILEAKRHLAAARYDEAEQAAARVPESSSLFNRACLIAGEAATKQRRLDDSLAYYAKIPNDGSQESIVGLLASGEILFHRGDLTEAEAVYRQVLDADPDRAHAHERLAHLLGIEGRRWESVPHLLALIRLDVFTLEHLVFLGDVDRMLELQEDEVAGYLERRDPGTLIGVARVAVNYNRREKAEELLREALRQQPHQLEGQARLGHLLLGPDSTDEFLRWHAALPSGADIHPEIWAVRGLKAQDDDQPEVAARCMWEAALRDPNHLLACHHLGRLLVQLGRPDDARPFLDRAELLRESSFLMNFIYTESARPLELRRAADLNESLGRLWEAWGWSRAALANDPGADWAADRIARLQPQLTPDLPRTLPESTPALAIDLSNYLVPDWPAPGRGGPSAPQDSSEAPAVELVFADRAADAGIDFRYFNDPDSSAHLGGWRMYQFTGGGAAALDFDGDYWPDLHLTQGCPWPPSENAGSHFDRLYRNLGTGRFDDVTDFAGVGDDSFSQGAAVGDLDGDGFPDLYVANIGRNRLYRNNGDGTFSDVTDEAGIRGDWWTTSAALADLNGDGHPEIFDANFLTGKDVYDLVCKGKGDKPRSCPPTHFPAAPDQLYLNRGDGGFDDVTDAAGITVPDGNGLGVVAADFGGTGKLDLFVANDSVPNFYFANQTPRGGSLAFREEAAARGVAVDRDGRAQACMGVAVDDADADGWLDLFVTNFYGESNTLYLQQPGGLFVDDTHAAGLREPSLERLGFGAHFLDAELDGLPDLVVTNGHVDDFTFNGTPYRMPPQLFRNRGEGRFNEVVSPSLGPYFSQDWLGRGLALVDWNRDGLEDFVVSHLLDDPVALVTNESQETGRVLALHLRGTAASRDAIGATVTIQAGGRTRTRQLTAGDGYLASNERRLVFGLGEADKVDALEIRWLSGAVQRFENLDADAELLLVEGRSRPLPITGMTR